MLGERSKGFKQGPFRQMSEREPVRVPEEVLEGLNCSVFGSREGAGRLRRVD